MKLHEIEQFFPRYSDESGFDVQIVYSESKHTVCHRTQLYHPSTRPGQRELTVKDIRCGLLRIGGGFDEQLTIYVEETEEVPEDMYLKELEDEFFEQRYKAEEEARERREYERLKNKFEGNH